VTIEHRRQINDDRRRQFDDRALIAFVCECADDACTTTVPLSAVDYDARRAASPGLILGAGHYSKNATAARIA
jgi:hypothetical protein